MKKIFTLLTGLLLLATPLLIAGCDNGEEAVNKPDGRLVSDVVIPTSMSVFKGMELTVEGRGFMEGDAIALRAATDLTTTSTILSPTAVTLVIPDEIKDQTIYKFMLTRGADYQILGASKLTVQLAININLGTSISAERGKSAVIYGNGFQTTDKLFLLQSEMGGGRTEVQVERADKSSLTFIMPQTATAGACQLFLQRGSEEQDLGTTTLSLSVPDKDDATIKGIVHCNGVGIADVLVSDGDLITKTDANGYYWLSSAKRNNLAFVILPSGYDVLTQQAIPQFWASCTQNAQTVEQLDFQLLKVENDIHTMLVATDMHLANRNNPKDTDQFANGFIKELSAAYNNTSEKVYCLNLGDFSWDLYWYELKFALPDCKKAIKDLNFQMWSAMGNHDNDPYVANDFGAEGAYRKNLGPVYYAMNIGKVHYIMLDDTEYTNAGGAKGTVGDREYNRRVSPEALAWLKADLQYVDKNTPIVVGLHCPIYSYSSLGSITTSLQSPADVANLLDCFAGFKSVNMLSGHTHVNRNIQSPTHANVYEHNVAAVCGTWWWTQQYGKNNVCTDGTPAGYKIFKASGTELQWHYKSVDLPQERQFMTYDMNSVKTYWTTDVTALKAFASGNLRNRENDYATVKENEVYINVWDYEPGWVISVNEGTTALDAKQIWGKYDPLHTISYDIPRGVTSSLTFPSTPCMHMFSVTASSATATLEITVTDRFGKVYSETMTRPKAFTTDLTK